jgi:hypothetical protein
LSDVTVAGGASCGNGPMSKSPEIDFAHFRPDSAQGACKQAHILLQFRTICA